MTERYRFPRLKDGVSMRVGIGEPAWITLDPIAGTQINVAWAAVSGADEYVLERSESADYTGSVVRYEGLATTFLDTGLTLDTTYYYRVMATRTTYYDSGWTNGNATTITPESSETDILTFSFTQQSGAATVDDVAHTVDIETVFGTDLSGLIATFTMSIGAAADISDVAQESAVTENDFSSPVTYTITAEDTTEQDWVITATTVQAPIDPEPDYVRSDATFENISIYYDLATLGQTDLDLDSTFSIEYRVYDSGGAFLPSAPTRRSWPAIYTTNFHAGSCMGLTPGTSYEVKTTFTDPDQGGSVVDVFLVTTKNYPVETSTYKYCTTGSSGGDGSVGDPWQGLQTAATNVSAGDTVLVADGTYAPFTLTTNGTAANPITFRAVNQHLAIIDADGGTYGIELATSITSIEHIIIDGFTITDTAHAGTTFAVRCNGGSFVTVKNCDIDEFNYGFAAYRELGYDHDCWVTNNSIVCLDDWLGAHSNLHAILLSGNNHVVSYNSLSDTCDGVHIIDNASGFPHQLVYSLDIHNNDINKCEDDGIEIDYAFANVRIYDNRLSNSLTGISAQPHFGGPYYILRNLIYNQQSVCLKLSNDPAGIVILHNTMIQKDASWVSSGGWWNTLAKNNVYMSAAVMISNTQINTGSVDDWNYNAYYHTSNYAIRWDATWYAGMALWNTGTGQGANALTVALADLEDVTLPTNSLVEHDPDTEDFTPAAGSDLIDAGIVINGIGQAGTDIGAYEFGATPPQYGHVFGIPVPLISNVVVENASPFDFKITLNTVCTGTTAGWTPKINGGAATKTGFAGSGSQIFTITVSDTITSTDTLTIDYDSGPGDTANATPVDLATDTARAVTNNISSGLGADLVGIGDFASGLTGWSYGSYVTSPASNCQINTPGDYSVIYLNIGLVPTTNYRLTIDITDNSAGGLTFASEAGSNDIAGNVTATGVGLTYDFAAVGTYISIKRYSGATNITFDNITVQEIL